MIAGGRWDSRRHTGKGKGRKKDESSLEAPHANFCLHPPHLALRLHGVLDDHFFSTEHGAASSNQGTLTGESRENGYWPCLSEGLIGSQKAQVLVSTGP